MITIENNDLPIEYEDVRTLDWFCADGERRAEDVPRVSDTSPTENLARKTKGED